MDKLPQNLPKLKMLSRQLADMGAVTTFAKNDSLFVLTIIKGSKLWKAECQTSTEVVERLSEYFEQNFRESL